MLLPPSYDPHITTFEARSIAELSSAFISSKYVDEYVRRIKNTESSDNATRAF